MYLTIHQHLGLCYRAEITTVVANMGKVLFQNQIVSKDFCIIPLVMSEMTLYLSFQYFEIQSPVSAIFRI